MDTEYRFKIVGAHTPQTLPMQRLAEYVGALAKLLGEETHVHLAAVEPGSAVVVAKVDQVSKIRVFERVLAVRSGDGPPEARKAFLELDDLLRKDNSTGVLASESASVMIPFPGRDRPEPLIFGPFRQDGTLEGQVIRVGGRDDTVPIHLREGAIIHAGLYTTPEIARRIAQHYLGPTLRIHGTGAWYRAADGSWELKSFRVTDFEVLGDAPLEQVVQALRDVDGSKWNEVPDPVRELLQQRHDEEDAH